MNVKELLKMIQKHLTVRVQNKYSNNPHVGESNCSHAEHPYCGNMNYNSVKWQNKEFHLMENMMHPLSVQLVLRGHLRVKLMHDYRASHHTETVLLTSPIALL